MKKHGSDDSGENKTRHEGSALDVAKSVGSWIIMPALFSKKNANPMQGVAQPLEALRSYYRKSTRFESFKDVESDNPEFEMIRPIAMRRLAMKRNIFLLSFVLLIGYEGVFGFAPFKVAWMDGITFAIFAFMSLTFSFVNDFTRVVFEHRVVGLKFFQYWGYRLGAHRFK